MFRKLNICFSFAVITLSFLCYPIVFASVYHNDVEKYKLSNGLTVILEEDHALELANVSIWIKAGSVYEGKYLGSGISHLIEHMVFKGSESSSSKELAQKLQALGGELDGATSFEYAHYDITVPSANLLSAMELVYQTITKADFDENELIKEKEVVLHEMAGIEDNPWKYITRIFWETAFQGHPSGEPIIGREPIFLNITRKDVLDYYESRYIPQNIVLVVVGDFEPGVLKTKIEEIWGKGLKAVPSNIDSIPEAVHVQGPLESVTLKSVAGPYLLMGFYGPSVLSQDMYAMDVIAEIIGGGKQSRFVNKYVNKQGVASGIDAWNYSPSYTGIFGINANLISTDWNSVKKDMIKDLNKLKLVQVKEKELDKAKKRIVRSYLSSIETIRGKSSDLGTSEIYTYNPLFADTYIRGIEKVTSYDIQEAAKKYFRRNSRVMCVLEPEGNILPLNNINSPITESASVDEITLENGMRVLIKEDHTLPLVNIRLVMLGGLLEESKPGLSSLFSELWLKTNPDIVSSIENIGGSISTHSGHNSLGCSIELLNKDCEIALRELYKLVVKFPITEKKFELAKNRQIAHIKQEDDSPYSYGFKVTKGVFFGDLHPYKNSVFGTEKSVSGITEKDVLDFKDKYLTPDNMVLVVSGDVNGETVSNLITNIFNDIPRGDFSGAVEFQPVIEKVSEHSENRDMKDTLIILACPGVSIYNDDRYCLEVIEQLFSGLAGRLFESVRNEKGLSYSVGSINFIGREPGIFIFYISTDMKNKEEALEILKGEIFRIKNELISEDELVRIKTYLSARFQEILDSNSGYSLEIALGELYALGWDYYKKHLSGIEAVTVNDVKRIANKYFRDDWYSLVVIGKTDSNDEKSE